MTSRGGRDRFRRDYPPRSEEKSQSGRSSAPPSRHLWVGNLSHSMTESMLADHFSRFGELVSVAFQPGRSYAFINFKREEEAIDAMRGLQGFPVAGMPLKIEFAKAEKSTPLHDENFLQRRDVQRSAVRGSPLLHRDSRTHSSPEPFFPDKSRFSDKSSEPSEVLWIGFPALLKVDEMILRKAFSPFGEIEKITVFPGRTYAFVQFRSLMAACRAKETLQGKLFGNPRVHICFAKSERGSSNSVRNSMNIPPSPQRFKANGHPGSSDNSWQERSFEGFSGDPGLGSHFFSNLESGDPELFTFSRKGTSWTGGDMTFEQRRFPEGGSELGLPEDVYEHRSSPTGDGGTHFHDYSSQKLPQRHPLYEDPWDLPEDASLFHGVKKLKTGSFPPDKELPDYPFPDSEKAKHAFPRMFSDFPRPEVLDKNVESGPIGYKQIPDYLTSSTGFQGERSNHWKASLDSYQAGSVSGSGSGSGSSSLPSSTVEWKQFAPEPRPSSLNEEWKWEGTIAKGGTPVCRARCFPVGRALDTMLPEFLDCTARTGLDMLAKHYYQAAGAWVVFFVPESDADIGFYNEFMNYMEEKQRAAVAKLDDKTTLFLVPPSDFSEKVLKVPGKLSISGVILRLEHPSSNFGSLQHLHEKSDMNAMSFVGDTSYPKPTSPPGSFPSLASFSNLGKVGANNVSYSGSLSTSVPPASFSGSSHATAGNISNISNASNENRQEHPIQQPNTTLGPNWSPHLLQNTISATRNIPSQAPINAVDMTVRDYRSVLPAQETSSGHYTTALPGIPLSESLEESKPPTSLSMPITALPPEQLARLASSLLGQQRQLGSGSNLHIGDVRHTSSLSQSDKPFTALQRYVLHNDLQSSQLSTSQFCHTQQPQQLQPQSQPQPQPQQQPQQQLQPQPQRQPQPQPQPQQSFNVPPVPCIGQMEPGAAGQGNQQLQSGGTQEEVETDPQKRLQATLQLAAALLQQIQQGKGT
ncbi:flowering time control protein FPA [Malania oleifera]|uniref:flowering time control protein FPA n=1 Tax=Malania oleifera TaxID=397392 RepID=UPI0025AE3D05|nr:flowering time control protein FPA [Malania oleifera]